MSNPGSELATDAAAATTVVGFTPGDDGAITFKRCEGKLIAEDFGDTRSQQTADTVEAEVTTPTHNRAISLQGRKTIESGEDLRNTGS